MKRDAIDRLYRWKESKYRKPLILEGAHRIGKTELLQQFGRRAYANTIYVNLEREKRLRKLLDDSIEPAAIIQWLEIYAGHKIDPENTLLIFDEVQSVPRAMISLKYFSEDAPQYHVACASSQTGIALKQGTSYPVGQVTTMRIYPLSFKEFLSATGRERLAETLSLHDFRMTDSIKSAYGEALRQYFFVGGMPEAVQCFSEERDFNKVREIQKDICASIETAFSKDASNRLVPKLKSVWQSVPSLLAKENKKFVYSAMRDAARIKDFEVALLWLSDCRLTYQVGRIEAPSLPLMPPELLKAFKLFTLDVGLLGCLCQVPIEILLEDDRIFTAFEGALTHQYVCQQLAALDDMRVYYYANSRGTSAVDFVVQNGTDLIPIEVMPRLNLRAKALKTYRDKFSPSVSVRTSMADYRVEDGLINLPLYAIGEFASVISDVRQK